MDDQAQDIELQAITTIMNILQPLDDEARKRIVGYVIDRLKISAPTQQRDRFTRSSLSSGQSTISESGEAGNNLQIDIRKLRETKLPDSAVEMAVLVAYYLSELAPDEERKSSVNSNDLAKYFKQAKFPLPRSMKDVLPHAKTSGFMESISHGEYKLTSVGYNLAVHTLPRNSKQ